MNEQIKAEEFAEYLSDDELSKLAPLLDRLSMLEN